MQQKTATRWRNRKEVRKRYNTSDRSLDRWVKAGIFPKPKVIGANTHRWDDHELDVYDADPDAWKRANAAS